MKDYKRTHPVFSLCGLNCALCPMHLNRYCPGCGGGAGHQPCSFIRCSLGHGQVEYCFQCEAYPCDKHERAMAYDSFVTHRHMRRDLERAKTDGLAAYRAELEEKVAILRELMGRYNDGRRKSFFCTAVNLLELEALKRVMGELERAIGAEASLKEKAACAARLFEEAAGRQGVALKLRRKPKQTQ